MKVEIIDFTKEGFVMARGLKFENGLVIKTDTLHWLGKAGKTETLKQFDEVVTAIKNHQIEIQ